MLTDMKSRFSRGIQKHIRMEKARIRHEFFDAADREEQIKKLYAKFSYMNPQEARETAKV